RVPQVSPLLRDLGIWSPHRSTGCPRSRRCCETGEFASPHRSTGCPGLAAVARPGNYASPHRSTEFEKHIHHYPCRDGSDTAERSSAAITHLHLLPRLTQRHRHIHLLLPAIYRDAYRISRPMIVHHLAQILLVLHILSIDADNQIPTQHDRNIPDICALIAATQSGALRRSARHYLHDE